MPASKLSYAEKCEIVRLKDQYSSAELAAKFQTGESTVRMIWKTARQVPAGNAFKAARVTTPHVSVLTGMQIGVPRAPAQEVLDIVGDEPLVTGGKTLDDLEPCHCRWIIGKDEAGDIRYCADDRCGALRGPTVMYCAAHAKRATVLPIAEDDLRRIPRPLFGSAVVSKYLGPRDDLAEAA